MLELGDDGPDYHREVGRHLSDLGIERVIAVGELSAHISDNCVSHALHFANTDQLLADCPEFFRTKRFWLRGPRYAVRPLCDFNDSICRRGDVLTWLAQQLAAWESAFSVFQYITLRGILSAMTALVISTLVGPRMIRWLRRCRSVSSAR